MYCNNHMLCLGDCPKTFKSLTYNHYKATLLQVAFKRKLAAITQTTVYITLQNRQLCRQFSLHCVPAFRVSSIWIFVLYFATC